MMMMLTTTAMLSRWCWSHHKEWLNAKNVVWMRINILLPLVCITTNRSAAKMLWKRQRQKEKPLPHIFPCNFIALLLIGFAYWSSSFFRFFLLTWGIDSSSAFSRGLFSTFLHESKNQSRNKENIFHSFPPENDASKQILMTFSLLVV